MHHFTSSLARRGIEVASTHYDAFREKHGGDEEVRVPAFFMLVISLTFLVFAGSLFAVSVIYYLF